MVRIGYFAFFGNRKQVQESSLVFHSGFDIPSSCVVTLSFFSWNAEEKQILIEIDGVSLSPYQVEIWSAFYHPYPFGPLFHVSFHFELRRLPP